MSKLLVAFAVALLCCASLVQSSEKPESTCVCPRNYQPLCASDGLTYSNNCEFVCARDFNIARGGEVLRIVKESSCGEEILE